MKKKIALLLIALSTLPVFAQPQTPNRLLGSWSGKLNAGIMKLTLVLHLQQAEGALKVTLDSPDQGAKGILATSEFLSEDSIAVRIKMINATYRARLKDNTLVGTFTQNGFSIPLELTKGIPEVKRPQHHSPHSLTKRKMCRSGTKLMGQHWPVR